jgi:hypothetical protein
MSLKRDRKANLSDRSTPDLLYSTSTPMAEEEDVSFNDASMAANEDRVPINITIFQSYPPK